ncbi:P27 family phage terminase small subunit [Bacillus amyloliquefaciens DSM 7]|jgi:P27 family predicted phage terminase small subunit|uniref:P27 family phage terminase small subunit n=2 Tax=Bacillaceae TaxID=186817 RepID=A0A9P1JF13_BACAS|nr:P27 family phage terminase small subunit [Bacillus amyloliquefaciens DSM 7] [Bacillus amyloliquefaciens DSM 7 = ATCC 23350]
MNFFRKRVKTVAMPAKSAKLTLLDGNKSRYTKAELEKRIENEEKMKMRAENIEPPSWLSATAKKEFKRLTELLLEVELINEADITHLAFYCDAYSQYISFERQIKKYGLWVDGKPNPFIMRKKDMAAQLRAYGSDLGLSPAARVKLAIKLESGEEEEEDDF